MRKITWRLGSLFMVMVVLLSAFPMTVRAVDEEWIEISDAAGLISIGSNLSGNYRLTADIDLGGAEWNPIGPFSGKLDGNSKVIRNFTINDTSVSNKGLFSSILAPGQISNLGIENASITAGSYAGILAGTNSGTISRSYTKGSVNGYEYVGGLVGQNLGTIENSFTQASVSGKDYLGGLAGANSETVEKSYAASPLAPSVFNNYVEFNGTSVPNSGGYIDIPHNDIYVGDKFTLEAWFQWDDVGTADVNFIMGKGVNQFEIHTGGPEVNGLRFIPIWTDNTDSFLDVKNAIQSGWFHVAAVYEYNSTSHQATAQVFINGEAQDLWHGTTNLGKIATLYRDANTLGYGKVGGILVAQQNHINIGRRTDGSYYFDGKISDVRFWNIARTGEDIKRDKDKVLTGSETGLVGYWKLNEASGDAIDSSTTHNNGTLVGDVVRTREAAAAYKGGLIGYNTGIVSDSYYDSEVSGQSDTIGTSKSTAGMKLQFTFTDWDFISIWGLDSEINSGYPYLLPEISAASVTMTAPAAGAIPQTAAQVETATGCEDYTVTDVVWNEELTPQGKFKAGQVYTANVTLTSKNGKVFQTEAFTPVAAGSASVGTTATNGTGVGNTVTFTVTFPETAAKSVIGIQVKTQPVDLMYIEGESLNLAGFEVTLTYNDSSTADVVPADFAVNGITASPANGTVLTVATHNGNPVTLTCNGYNAITSNLAVNADTRTITGYYADNSGSDTALTTTVTVPYGTAEEAAKAGLSTSGYAKLSDNSYVAVTISWAFDEAYNGSAAGAKAVTGTVTGTFPGEQVPTNRTGTVTVEAAPTYTIAEISDQTMTAKTSGYGSGTQETKTITVTRTGTGDLANLAVSLSGGGSSNFVINQPLVATLNAGTPSTTFTVKAKDGLAAGTYTETVTVSADNMTNVTFTVTQVVNTPADTQATPSFSPAGGAIAFGSTVTVTSAGAEHIYYTTDGTDPATSVGGSTLEYAVPITVNAAMTIKAIATKTGNLDSTIGSASYTQVASADLTGLALSGSPSNFTFAGSTYTYDEVTVANGVSSITVTPTGAGTIAVDGTPVTSGQASEDIALTAGIQKTITVVVTETGKSAITYTVKVTREMLNAPPAPTIQSAVAGDAHVTITWNSVSEAAGYKIFSSTTSGSYGMALATVSDSVYSYDAIGLDNGTTYYFVVKATNGGGNSDYSNEVSAIPQVSAPGAPVLQSASAGDGHVNISWSGVAGSTGYKIFSSMESGSYDTPIATVTDSVYSYDVTDLDNGTIYYFVVTATNPGGDSAYSNEIGATPQVPAPSAPTGVTATEGNAKVTLNWNSVIGATGYRIFQSTASGTYGSAFNTVAGSVYSYEATGLTNGVTYYFVIKATNAGGDSPNSAEVSAMPKTVPGVPINVSAMVGNRQATVSFTAPADDGGSPITEYIVTSSPGNIEVTGTGTTITVTGLTNGTTYTFTVKAVNEVGTGPVSPASNAVTPFKPSSGDSDRDSDRDNTPSTPATPSRPANGVDILVNGKAETAATVTTTQNGNNTVTTIVIDDKKVEQRLTQEGNHAVVTISVNNGADVVVGQLNGQTVKNMETKDAVLEIKTGQVIYTLPASQVNIDAISEQIGKDVALKDITVSVKISEPTADTVKIIEDTANKNNYQIVVKPVEFEITCSSGNKTVEVSKFNTYVERLVAIPESIDPSKITTGIILNEDGSFSHVPTVIIVIDGKYYAKINSLTNSVYSVISSPKTFADVENHWAKEAVNDMASRLIIGGGTDGLYDPDGDITRAEFAAILVRALGLMHPGAGKDVFNDVAKKDWYYDAVSIAYEYGIISGYGSGKFRPTDSVTREQAMTMIARAMKITKLDEGLTGGEASKILAGLTDGESISAYAKTGIAACVKTGIISGRSERTLAAPKDNITRAEVAVIVRRLLQQSGLI